MFTDGKPDSFGSGNRAGFPLPEVHRCGCYCAYREIGYFVGVKFRAGTQWSEDVFLPQHLLDTGRLELEKDKDAVALEIPVQ